MEGFVPILVGDIGGTNARFSLKKVTKANKSKREIIKEGKLATMDYKTFADALKAFLLPYKGTPEYPRLVSIGIAGPRKGDMVKITNAIWPEFNIQDVKKELGFDAMFILNDFEANGYGVLAMTEDMYTEVTTNPVMPDAPKALLGTGTGLGECIVTKSEGGNYVVFPGEGGHVDFAPRNELEFGLMEYVKKKLSLDRVSYERCCCGLAIPLMYDYLKGRAAKAGEADSAVHEKIKLPLSQLIHLLESAPGDETINKRVDELDRVIFSAGMKKEDKVCTQTVELFAALYGAEAGNLALKILPYGGVYLMSSVTLAMKDHILKEPAFMVWIFTF